jgi:hypothetical protein
MFAAETIKRALDPRLLGGFAESDVESFSDSL